MDGLTGLTEAQIMLGAARGVMLAWLFVVCARHVFTTKIGMLRGGRLWVWFGALWVGFCLGVVLFYETVGGILSGVI